MALAALRGSGQALVEGHHAGKCPQELQQFLQFQVSLLQQEFIQPQAAIHFNENLE